MKRFFGLFFIAKKSSFAFHTTLDKKDESPWGVESLKKREPQLDIKTDLWKCDDASSSIVVVGTQHNVDRNLHGICRWKKRHH